MCNSNGACRKASGVMCPSYRVTRDEQDVTRGRATALRLALTGQLGPDALTSDALYETLDLCVSCKACKRECPTGVDMARMKIEVSRARVEKFGLTVHDRRSGICRVTRLTRRGCIGSLICAMSSRRGKWSETIAGFSSGRTLPKWRADWFRDEMSASAACGGGREGAGSQESRTGPLLDRFAIRPPPQAGEAKSVCPPIHSIAIRAREDRRRDQGALGRRLSGAFRLPTEWNVRCVAAAPSSPSARWTRRAGRTRVRLRRSRLTPPEAVPVIGLEPSCLFSFRDEIPSLVKSESARKSPIMRCCLRSFWRGRCNRQARPQTRADEKTGAAARPLSSKIFRHDGRGRGDAEAHSRS